MVIADFENLEYAPTVAALIQGREIRSDHVSVSEPMYAYIPKQKKAKPFEGVQMDTFCPQKSFIPLIEYTSYCGELGLKR